MAFFGGVNENIFAFFQVRTISFMNGILYHYKDNIPLHHDLEWCTTNPPRRKLVHHEAEGMWCTSFLSGGFVVHHD